MYAVLNAPSLPGPMLAQAQAESRLRDSYRSMLMQLQHRYQVQKEQQEEVHRMQLQEQVRAFKCLNNCTRTRCSSMWR